MAEHLQAVGFIATRLTYPFSTDFGIVSVAVAESVAFGRVFTIDSDFRIYRLSNGSMVNVIPIP